MAVTGGLREDIHMHGPEGLQPFGLVLPIQKGMQAKEYPLGYLELNTPIDPVIDTVLLWLGGATANCHFFG